MFKSVRKTEPDITWFQETLLWYWNLICLCLSALNHQVFTTAWTNFSSPTRMWITNQKQPPEEDSHVLSFSYWWNTQVHWEIITLIILLLSCFICFHATDCQAFSYQKWIYRTFNARNNHVVCRELTGDMIMLHVVNRQVRRSCCVYSEQAGEMIMLHVANRQVRRSCCVYSEQAGEMIMLCV